MNRRKVVETVFIMIAAVVICVGCSNAGTDTGASQNAQQEKTQDTKQEITQNTQQEETQNTQQEKAQDVYISMDDYNPDSSIAPKRTFFYNGKEISMPRKVRDLEKLAGSEIKSISIDKMGSATVWFSDEEEKASRLSVTVDTSEFDELNTAGMNLAASYEDTDKQELMEKLKEAPITGLYFSSYYFIPDTVYENISLIPDHAIFDTDYSGSEITEYIADYYNSIVDTGDGPDFDSEAIEWFNENYPEIDMSEYIADDNLDSGSVEWDERNNTLDFSSFGKGYTFSWVGGLGDDRKVNIYYFSDSILAYREFIDNKRAAYSNNACYYCSDIVHDNVDDTTDEEEELEFEEERKFSIGLADLTRDGIGELIIYNGECTYAIELDKKSQTLNVIAYDEGHCYVTERCAWVRRATDDELQSSPDGKNYRYKEYYYMFDENRNRWQLAEIDRTQNGFLINGEEKSAEEVQDFEKKLGYSDGYYVFSTDYDEIIEFFEDKDKFNRINIDYAHEAKKNGEVLVLEDFIGQ